MQRKNVLSVLFLLAYVTGFAQFQITGRVSNKETSEPLSGANVVISNTYLATTSGPGGRFILDGLKQGTYTLECTYIGFEKFQQEISLVENATVVIELQPTVYMSDEVIISAVRAGGETTTTSVRLDAPALNRKNEGKDLPYFMQSLPSTVITSDAGNGVGYTGIRIRGTDLTGINVTMNGVPVNDPESHQVYFVDMPDLVSSVDDIRVQRGVGSSTNGSAAFGASINIKTGEVAGEPYGGYSTAAGSFGTWKNTLAIGSGMIKDRWAFDGRASFIRSNGYIDRASSHLMSLYFSGGYYGKKDIFKFNVINGKEKTYQAWYGTPKDSLSTNRTYNPAGAIYDEEGQLAGYYDNQTDNYVQTYYQAHYAHEFSTNLNLAATLFLTRGQGFYENYKNDRSYIGYGFSDTVIGSDTITRSDMITQKWLDNYFYGMNLSLNYAVRKWQFNFGAGWNNYDGDHYGKIIWAQVATLGMYDKDWYFNTGLKQDYNVFAKVEYRIRKIGVYTDLQYRGIYYRIEGTHDDLRDLTQTHRYNFFNPKLGMSYAFSPKNEIFLYAGIANREPNRSVFRDADPDQEVKPERMLDIEAGYKFSATHLRIETNLFYMDYKDQLVMTGMINNVGTPVLVNVPESYRAGIELMAGFQLFRIVEWNLNATYSQNKIDDFTEFVDNWNYWDDPANEPYQYEKYLGKTDISFSPDWVAGSNLAITPLKDFTITLMTSYVGRQFIDNTSDKERSLNPYLVNNLRLFYQMKVKHMKSLEFLLSLNNLFNEQYETSAWVYRYVYDGVESEINGYFPQAGFNFMFGVNLKF